MISGLASLCASEASHRLGAHASRSRARFITIYLKAARRVHQSCPNTRFRLVILSQNSTLIRHFVYVSNWPCQPWAYEPWPMIAPLSHHLSHPISHHPRTLSHHPRTLSHHPRTLSPHCAGCESCILQCFKHFRPCEQYSCDTLAHA
jgi:hypothetical protein